MARSGNFPLTSWTTQSRKPPSGSAFSVLQAMTQALQPTQRRVSTAIAKRGLRSSGMPLGLPCALDAHEVHVHGGPAHERVHLVAAGELRVGGAAPVGVALAARRLAPA